MKKALWVFPLFILITVSVIAGTADTFKTDVTGTDQVPVYSPVLGEASDSAAYFRTSFADVINSLYPEVTDEEVAIGEGTSLRLFTLTKLKQFIWNIVGDLYGSHYLSWYSNIDDALTAIGATETTLVVDKAISLGANTTIPATLALKVQHGATITLGAYDLDLSSCPQFEGAPGCFDYASTGVVTGLNNPDPEYWTVNAVPGTTDMTTALNAAGSQSGTMQLKNKTYKVTSGVTSSIPIAGNNATIDASGATLASWPVDTLTSHRIVVLIEGDGFTAISDLSVAAEKGDTSLTFASAPSLSTGDIICIYNPTDSSYSGFRTYYRAGEYCIVESVSGNTVNLQHPLYADYTAADVDIYDLSTIDGSVSDLTIVGIGDATNYDAGLVIRYTKNSMLSNIKMSNASYMGISIANSVGVSVLDCRSQSDISNPSLNNYPLAINNSQDIKVRGGFYSCSYWHGITTGGGSGIGSVPCRNVVIDGATVRSGGQTACIGLHGNIEHYWITNNELWGAISFSGNYGTISNNKLHKYNYGRAVYGTELSGFDHSILNNEIVSDSAEVPGYGAILDVGGNATVLGADTPSGGTFTFAGNKCIWNLASTTSQGLLSINNRGYTGTEKINVLIRDNEIIVPDESVYIGSPAIVKWWSGDKFNKIEFSNNYFNAGIRTIGSNITIINKNNVDRSNQYGMLFEDVADFVEVIGNNVTNSGYAILRVNGTASEKLPLVKVIGNIGSNNNRISATSTTNCYLSADYIKKLIVQNNEGSGNSIYQNRKFNLYSIDQVWFHDNTVAGKGTTYYNSSVAASNWQDSAPNAGEWNLGDVVTKRTATSGTNATWICTTTGRIAPAWVGSTPYEVGDYVLSDTNKIYICVTAGTSAAAPATGPAGTGTTAAGTPISDGSVVWDYYSPLAVFISGPVLP